MSRLLVIAGLALLTSVGSAQSRGKPLNDAALDRVTAGTVTASVSDGVVNFQGSAQTANGLVSSSGTMAVQGLPLSSSTTTGTLSLSGSAQQNLSSLININAVNSKINVLMNLNVNINSTVGSILQSNLNGKH